MPNENTIEIEIEKLIYGGDGLARRNGKSVFVPRVLPGERLLATLQEDRRSFSRAEPQRWITTAPERVAPGCPYFTECGGCHYQHATYAAQLELKRDIFIETLRRTGKVEVEVPVELHASPEPWKYRNRTRLHMQHVPKFSLGYFVAGSHRLLPVRECPISSPLLNRAIALLWQIGDAAEMPPFIFEVEVFADDTDQHCLVELYVGSNSTTENRPELSAFEQRLLRELPGCTGVHAFLQSATVRSAAPTVQHVGGAGADALDYRVGSDTYRVSAGSFFQVNRFLISRFIELVTSGYSGDRALDLYAGAGLFAVPLARHFRQLIAVESSTFSFSDLEHNLPSSATPVAPTDGSPTDAAHLHFCQTTESFLRHRAELAIRCELAVVDPPRAGLGAAVVQALASAAPRNIVYASCDPSTLARDLRSLLESGYRIAEAHLVDMFPQTFHIESVIRLQRNE